MDNAQRIGARWVKKKFLPPNKSHKKKQVMRNQSTYPHETDTCMSTGVVVEKKRLHIQEEKHENTSFASLGRVQARCYVVLFLYHFFWFFLSSYSLPPPFGPRSGNHPLLSKFPSIFPSLPLKFTAFGGSLALQDNAPSRGRSSSETMIPSLLLKTTSCSSQPFRITKLWLNSLHTPIPTLPPCLFLPKDFLCFCT